MKESFDRKVFTAGIFFKDAGFLLSRIPTIVGALCNRQINRGFTEKIMLVTTAVNGCTYCSWFHAKQALTSGIGEEEIKNMVNLQFKTDASDFETGALLYAQHYAETDRNPEEELTRRFVEYYGSKTAKHIFVFIRMIFFGNLFGNTWDAFLSRMKGSPAKNSSILFELFFALCSFWFMVPLMIISNQ
jgi:AhpD family alkylhydroperoxidase